MRALVGYYNIEDIRELLATYAEQYVMGDAGDFVDWLARCAEVDDLIEGMQPEDIDQSEPVDLFGTGGVKGLANADEIAALGQFDDNPTRDTACCIVPHGMGYPQYHEGEECPC